MGDPQPESPRPDDAKDFGAHGHSIFSIPEEKSMGKLYGKLTPDQRTWRCEQMKKSADLMDQSWELLRPITEGRWDKENAYTGLALFLKSIYEGQGYAALNPTLTDRMGDLMRIVQEHMPYTTSGGRRVQGDDNPAKFALRVAFNCITLVTAVGLSFGTTERASHRAEKEEMRTRALQMAVGCLDKLGGPLTHEGTMTAEEKAYFARLATAPAGSDMEGLIHNTPFNVLAIYVLQAQYDIELRVIKWILHYVAARFSKDAYSRERSVPGAARGTSGTAAARAAWLSHSQALGRLDPGSSLAAFMVAEAKSAEGGTSESLTLMKAAAATAERRGDDLVAWLARLNVAHLMVHGACGATFSEDEVLQEMDAAASQKGSARRWGGAVILDPRCRTLKESLQKTLQAAREQKQQLAESRSKSKARGDDAKVDDGRLPSIVHTGQWGMMTPVAKPHRECAGCNKLFHKSMACGKCKQVWYCGKDCQRAHWKAGHKKECAALANAASRAATAAVEDDE